MKRIVILTAVLTTAAVINVFAAQKANRTRSDVSGRKSGVQTAYYSGPVTYSSADGKTEYGRTVSLVKREIAPARGYITETVMQPAHAAGGKPEEYITVFTRSGPTTLFNVKDKGNTFSGTVFFTRGAAWEWTEWTYDINLAAGGTIKGKGELSAVGITTKKMFTDKAGAVTAITEELKAISRAQYDARRESMSAGAKTK